MIEFIYDHIKYFEPFELEKSPGWTIKSLFRFKNQINVIATLYSKTFDAYTGKDLRLIHEDIVKEIYDNIKYHMKKENLWND